MQPTPHVRRHVGRRLRRGRSHQGLHGLRGAAASFGAIYSQDMVMITALGLGKPWTWSRKEATIDVLDNAVHIAATSMIFDRILSPSTR